MPRMGNYTRDDDQHNYSGTLTVSRGDPVAKEVSYIPLPLTGNPNFGERVIHLDTLHYL